MDHSYRTIESHSVAEFHDRGSRFIAYAFPLETIADFRLKLAGLKKEHPKAAHHCFAYRIGLGNDVFRSSDDGEPSGSAGRPILGQIDSKKLTNVLVIVVRYFGGTLLGVPGLIRAYKTSASYALDQAIIIEKPILIDYRLEFDYTSINEVMKLLRQFNCTIRTQEMHLFCTMDIGVPLIQQENFKRIIADYHNIQVKMVE